MTPGVVTALGTVYTIRTVYAKQNPSYAPFFSAFALPLSAAYRGIEAFPLRFSDTVGAVPVSGPPPTGL